MFKPPEAYVTYKAKRPDRGVADKGAAIEGATITVNGEKLLDERGEFAVTPKYSVPYHVGDKLTITFERSGYEPVTIERDVVFRQQDIEADLRTAEEIAAANLTVVPSFTVTTAPEGATIKVNGADKGKSPVTLENIAYGKELRIEASLDDYATATRTYVASRKSDAEMKIKLEPAGAAKQAAPERKTVAKSTVAKKSDVAKKSPSAAKVASGTGKITVKAKPWGVITIDGSRVGNTSISKEVKSGTHKVEIVLPNKNLKTSKSVTVKPNETVSIGYDFNAGKWM